jgi:hypothetical protein
VSQVNVGEKKTVGKGTIYPPSYYLEPLITVKKIKNLSPLVAVVKTKNLQAISTYKETRNLYRRRISNPVP